MWRSGNVVRCFEERCAKFALVDRSFGTPDGSDYPTFGAMAGVCVFYFGRNDSMMALVGQQLQAAGMDAHGFRDEVVLAAELAKGEARLLVIGAGVEDEPRERLRAVCVTHSVLFHEHFEGPTALVEHVTRLLA